MASRAAGRSVHSRKIVCTRHGTEQGCDIEGNSSRGRETPARQPHLVSALDQPAALSWRCPGQVAVMGKAMRRPRSARSSRRSLADEASIVHGRSSTALRAVAQTTTDAGNSITRFALGGGDAPSPAVQGELVGPQPGAVWSNPQPMKIGTGQHPGGTVKSIGHALGMPATEPLDLNGHRDMNEIVPQPAVSRGRGCTAPEVQHALLAGTLRTSTSDSFCLAVELHLLLLGSIRSGASASASGYGRSPPKRVCRGCQVASGA